MENTSTCTCGVPNHLHATACGWSNANLILYPTNAEEIEWQRLKLESIGGVITISGTGMSYSFGHFGNIGTVGTVVQQPAGLCQKISWIHEQNKAFAIYGTATSAPANYSNTTVKP